MPQSDGNAGAEDAARVWQRLLTQLPHPFAVARARGTLQTFTPTKDSSPHARQETPALTELLYDVWRIKSADLQQFAEAALISPAVLQFFSQILQAVVAPANIAVEPSTTIADAS